MAISVQPVDGLINRLLQQNSRAPSAAEKAASTPTAPSRDQVNISSEALLQRQALSDRVEQQQRRESGKALESHLLSLYKTNDASRG